MYLGNNIYLYNTSKVKTHGKFVLKKETAELQATNPHYPQI